MRTWLMASCLAFCVVRASAAPAAWLDALAEVETGNRPWLVGAARERTAYQITPAVWRRYAGPAAGRTARRVAERILDDRVAGFRQRHRRQPTTREVYLLWHRPARVLRPRPLEAERARRFAALVADIQRQGGGR